MHKKLIKFSSKFHQIIMGSLRKCGSNEMTSAALEAAKCMSKRKKICLIGCVGKHKMELSFQHTDTST